MLDPREQRLVLSQRLLAGDDAPVRNAAVDVLPDLFVEFRLVAHLLEHGHVRRDVGHRAVPGRLRNAFCQRAAAEMLTPLIEAGRRGEGRDRLREQGRGREAGSQYRAAGQGVPGIRLAHIDSVAARAVRSKAITPRELAKKPAAQPSAKSLIPSSLL